jgi:hypothetical protein
MSKPSDGFGGKNFLTGRTMHVPHVLPKTCVCTTARQGAMVHISTLLVYGTHIMFIHYVAGLELCQCLVSQLPLQV